MYVVISLKAYLEGYRALLPLLLLLLPPLLLLCYCCFVSILDGIEHRKSGM